MSNHEITNFKKNFIKNYQIDKKMKLFTTDIQKYTIDIDDDVSDKDASSNDFNYYSNDDYGADDQLSHENETVITDYCHVVKFS